jgi:hypothetical protein
MVDIESDSRIVEISLSSESSGALDSLVKSKRGRKKRGRKKNSEPQANEDLTENEVNQKQQEKVDKRKELIKKHQEDIKWQAVDKILNEKGRKEKEKEKKLKKDIEDSKAKEAAIEAKKMQALSHIHVKHFKDGHVTLSFPVGFLLPKVLSQQKTNGNGNGNGIHKCNSCMQCGMPSKYCNPKNQKYSCSLKCFKALN